MVDTEFAGGLAMRFALTLALLLGAVGGKPIEFANHGCDCETFSLRDGEEPVCGTDGLIYATACLAHCQGVNIVGSVASGTPCGGQRMAIAHPGHYTDDWRVPSPVEARSIVGKFSVDGFRYLGVSNRTRQAEWHEWFINGGRVSPVYRDHDELLAQMGAKGGGPPGFDGEVAALVDMMYTSDGHVYGRKSAVSPRRGPRSGGRGRKLAQVGSKDGNGVSETQFLSIFGDNGADDRAEVTNTNADPYKRVGYIDPIGCTGSLVGPRHVLTAGHCIFSLDYGVLFPVTFQFSPGRSKGSNPYGTVDYDKIMIKGCFTSAGLPECDFAVIFLKEDIGQRTGVFGVGLDCDTQSVNLHIAGYPSDKPNQSMWRETCGEASVSCSPDPKLIIHACDVVEGTSGSPLWDDSMNVRAIHKGAVFTRDLRYGNIAVYITPYVHDNIKQWLDQSG